MRQHTKLTLDALISKKMQREQDKLELKPCYVPCLDAELMLKKIPVPRITSMFDNLDGESMASGVDFNVELIYASCPLLQDHALHEEFGVVEPYDIVLAVFDDNLGAMEKVAVEILGFYGLGKELKETLKN